MAKMSKEIKIDSWRTPVVVDGRSEDEFFKNAKAKSYFRRMMDKTEPLFLIIDKNGYSVDSSLLGFNSNLFGKVDGLCRDCGEELKTHFVGKYTKKIFCPKDVV
jgi:hypothetical protein